ncbi:hypothetical protein [Serratia quinivorans]
MSFKRTDLVFDMFYASESDSGDKIAKITIQIRDTATGAPQQISTVHRRTAAGTKAKTYGVGLQSVTAGGDALLVGIEEYFRTDPKTTVEGLMAVVMDFLESSVDSSNTWFGVYGMKIISDGLLADYLPASVLDKDGGATVTQP